MARKKKGSRRFFVVIRAGAAFGLIFWVKGLATFGVIFYVFNHMYKMLLSIMAGASVLSAQKITHVMTSAGAGMPESADFSIKPMGYEFGLTYNFLVEGENIVMIKEDSVKTDQAGWKMGPFAKVQEDGGLGTFSIRKKGDYLGKESEEKVSGTVTIVTGSETEEKTFTLSKKGEPVMVGELKVSLDLGGAKFMSGKGVKVVGDYSKVKSITINEEGKAIESNGASWDDKAKTFSFDNIKEGVEVTVTWWKDLAEKEVAFSKN